MSRYTRAKLFQEAGKRTPLAIRFSTVIGGRDSSEVARDPRGFAVKFYKPSHDGGLRESDINEREEEVGPELRGRLTRAQLERTNDYEQPGQRYQLMEQWEKDDLVKNFVDNIGQASRGVQERMVWHFFMCDDELGRRVGEGLGISADDVRHLEPLPHQQLTEAELERARNLGSNGPRDVEALQMTHCVPNARGPVSTG